jgi:CheY-like chemotaxis protein
MTAVLLVEDDSYLGPLMVRELEAKGYDTYFATTFDEAYELIEMDGPFDALVTDYEFPGGNGCDVIDYNARQEEPTPLVILWSGLDRTYEVRMAGLIGVVDHILTKDALDKLFEVLP